MRFGFALPQVGSAVGPASNRREISLHEWKSSGG